MPVRTWIQAALLANLLPLAVTSDVEAQIYRCEHEGKVSFSDRPCQAGAKASQKTYATSGTLGKLDVQIEVNRYTVQGRDYQSLKQSLDANGPKGFHGLARWNVNYEYDTKQQGDACRINVVRMKISGEILMPRWADEQAAPAQLRQRWRRYSAALQRHEDGHIQHGRELALLVKERLMGLGSVPCDQLQRLAQREFDRVYGNLKARDQEYDARTHHGATQDALF